MKNTLGDSKKSIFGAMKYVVVASALAATLLLPKTSTAQAKLTKLFIPRYVPTTRAFIEKLSKLSGEDINSLRVFTDQDILKRQKQKPEDLDYSGAYVYVDPQGKSHYRYSPDMLRAALDTTESPIVRSASEYREQNFTAVTESEFRRWSKLNNADTPLLDQTSSKEGSKCYMTTSVNNHMGDRDPANYYYWIDYNYPGTVRYGDDEVTPAKEADTAGTTNTDTTTTSTDAGSETSPDLDFDSSETKKAFETLAEDIKIKNFGVKLPYMVNDDGLEFMIDSRSFNPYNGNLLIQDQSVEKDKRVLCPAGNGQFSGLFTDLKAHGLNKGDLSFFLNNNDDARSKFFYVSKFKKEHIDYIKKMLFEDIPNFIRSAKPYIPPIYREERREQIYSGYVGTSPSPNQTKIQLEPAAPANQTVITEKSLDALIDE